MHLCLKRPQVHVTAHAWDAEVRAGSAPCDLPLDTAHSAGESQAPRCEHDDIHCACGFSLQHVTGDNRVEIVRLSQELVVPLPELRVHMHSTCEGFKSRNRSNVLDNISPCQRETPGIPCGLPTGCGSKLQASPLTGS